MKPTRAAIIAYLLPAYLLTTAGAINAADAPNNRITIKAADISDRVTIIGLLGLPLDELMDIRGTWVASNSTLKEVPGIVFSVTHRNGEDLETPVIMTHVRVDARLGLKWHLGETWEFRGIEHGEFYGLPQAFYNEASSSSVIASGGEHGFRTVFYSAKAVKKDVKP